MILANPYNNICNNNFIHIVTIFMQTTVGGNLGMWSNVAFG